MIAETLARSRMTLWLMGSFAFVALSLAAVGVYGVMAYAVEQRSKEMAIRVALGARRSDIVRLVV